MKIGIDARLIHETGVGRYVRNLIAQLGKTDQTNTYVVFLRKAAYQSFTPPNVHWQKRLADVQWHSVTEQLFMPAIYWQEHLDLLHVPYFNVPLFYFGKFVVTIHDLTILHFDTGKASTLPYVFYKLKRIGYHLELMKALFWAEKIIAVSEVTKTEITDHFDILRENIEVTHEGIDKELFTQSSPKREIKEPYFLYVGNAYPHKNLEILIESFASLITDYRLPITPRLVLVGKDDFFYRRLRETEKVKLLGDKIVFKTVVSDSVLSVLYRFAQASVFPSVMEGFGLPPLEALSLGCPVIVADIPVFHELLGAASIYFDPHDTRVLTNHLKSALGVLRTKSFTQKARAIVSKYSWQKMARETLSVYESSL